MHTSTTETIDRLEREAQTRIHTARHVLVSRLEAAQLHVTRAAQHARAGHIEAARGELAEASAVLASAVGDDGAIAGLRLALGVTPC